MNNADQRTSIVDVDTKVFPTYTSEGMNTTRMRCCRPSVCRFDVTAAIVSPHDFSRAALSQRKGPQSVKRQEDFPTHPTSCLDLYIQKGLRPCVVRRQYVLNKKMTHQYQC